MCVRSMIGWQAPYTSQYCLRASALKLNCRLALTKHAPWRAPCGACACVCLTDLEGPTSCLQHHLVDNNLTHCDSQNVQTLCARMPNPPPPLFSTPWFKQTYTEGRRCVRRSTIATMTPHLPPICSRVVSTSSAWKLRRVPTPRVA